MILIDKNIREKSEKEKLIVPFEEKCLNCVSYDLKIDEIIGDSDDRKQYVYELKPNETIFVKTKEKLNMPNDLLGVVTEKNSRMRQGLKVDAPRYQPGHSTYMFLRVQNISHNVITLQKDDKIAQIMFETLQEEPETPYSQQINASFNDEEKYKGLGKYQNEYSKQIKDVESTIEKSQRGY